MATVPDLLHSTLTDLGFSGTVNDQLKAYFESLGYTGQLDDLWGAFMAGFGYDTLHEYLEGKGYTGTTQDMLLDSLIAGDFFEVFPVWHAATYDPNTYEFVLQSVGSGTPSTTHTATIYAKAYDGNYYAFATDAPVIYNGRLSGGTWYMDGNNDGVITGYLVAQQAYTNSQKRSYDLTHIEWTKTNVTAATGAYTDLTGGTTLSSRLLATANNGTAIANAITAGAATHVTKWWIKRDVGTGTIELTLDNGATWTNVTGQVTATFNEIVVSQAALTNPQIGIRLGTSGDAVIIGNAECHLTTTSNTIFGAGPIYTTSAAAATDAVYPTFDIANIAPGAWYIEYSAPVAMSSWPVNAYVALLTGTAFATPTDAILVTLNLGASYITRLPNPGSNTDSTGSAHTAFPHRQGAVYSSSENKQNCRSEDDSWKVTDDAYHAPLENGGGLRLCYGGTTTSVANYVHYVREARLYDLAITQGKDKIDELLV